MVTASCPGPGGALPHEDVLAADCQASHNTVRHALDLPRAEQLIERLSGVGTVVLYVERLRKLNGLPLSPGLTCLPLDIGGELRLERFTRLCNGRPVDLEFIRFGGDRIAMSGLPAIHAAFPSPLAVPHWRQSCPWCLSGPTYP